MAKPPPYPRGVNNHFDRESEPQRSGATPPPLPPRATASDTVPATTMRAASSDRRMLWYSMGGGAGVGLLALLLIMLLTKSTGPQTEGKGTKVAESKPAQPAAPQNPLDVPSAKVDVPPQQPKSEPKEVPPDPPVPVVVADADLDVKKPGDQVAEPEMEPEPIVADDQKPDVPGSRQDNLIEKAGELIAAIRGKQEKEAIATFKEAVTTLRRASNLYPQEMRADFYLGLLHSGVGIGEPKTAETHFNKVLERSSGHVATLNNLVLVQVRNRRFPVVRNYLGLAMKTDPRPKEVVQNLGRVFAQSRLLELKGDELKKITALNTGVVGYQPSVGWLYMPFDETPKSLDEYQVFCRDGQLEDTSCLICNGRGHLPCTQCEGHGSLLHSGTVSGIFVGGYGAVATSTPVVTVNACPRCHGRGHVDCTVCRDGRDPTLKQSPTQ